MRGDNVMKCNCGQYQDNEEKKEKERYWSFEGPVYMGKLYKCPYCGTLWAEYMSGHGWTSFYKIKPNMKLQKPALEIGRPITSQEKLTAKSLQIWNEILKMIPKIYKQVINDVIIPDDIISVLRYLYKDEKEIKKWLFTCRVQEMQFETPIEIIKNGEETDRIRRYLLNSFIRKNKVI